MAEGTSLSDLPLYQAALCKQYDWGAWSMETRLITIKISTQSYTTTHSSSTSKFCQHTGFPNSNTQLTMSAASGLESTSSGWLLRRSYISTLARTDMAKSSSLPCAIVSYNVLLVKIKSATNSKQNPHKKYTITAPNNETTYLFLFFLFFFTQSFPLFLL